MKMLIAVALFITTLSSFAEVKISTSALFCNGSALTNSDGKTLLTYTDESSCQDTVQSSKFNL